MRGKKHIKTWVERCKEHPDHNGIVSERMIKARMQEEIDELRDENERLREALEKIATVNAMDYEYVRWAKAALRREET